MLAYAPTTTCVGVRCDLCDEMHCRDRMRAREGIRICPVCMVKLEMTNDDTEPMWIGGLDMSRYPFRPQDYR